MASSASSKPTGVHFALVIFIMTTLILALVCYLVGREYSAAQTKSEQDIKKASEAESRLRTAITEIQALKDVLGYENVDIGAVGDQTTDTLIGQVSLDLARDGGEHVKPSPQLPTVRATLPALRALLDSVNKDLLEAKQNVTDLQKKLADEQAAHEARIANFMNSSQASENQLVSLTTNQAELLAGKDRTINQQIQEIRTLQRQIEQVRDEFDAYRKDMDERMVQKDNTLKYQRELVNKMEQMSFDMADGEIVQVDNTTRTVWINLGSQAGLRPQVGFSVYVKNHQGVGRGREDIKGKIEVTEIRGDLLAQARIISDDIKRPIQKGDPIYSPIWERGSKEFFSFVGIMDLDGDGKSDDELLRNLILNAGGGIEVYVNDAGERIPADGKLSRSKFLVVGALEDPATVPTNDSARREQIERVGEQKSALDQDALNRGIRVVSLNDFLNYIGHERQQQLFSVGDEPRFKLRSGAQSLEVNEPLGSSRFSDGVTSEFFKRFQGTNGRPPEPIPPKSSNP